MLLVVPAAPVPVPEVLEDEVYLTPDPEIPDEVLEVIEVLPCPWLAVLEVYLTPEPEVP